MVFLLEILIPPGRGHRATYYRASNNDESYLFYLILREKNSERMLDIVSRMSIITNEQVDIG